MNTCGTNSGYVQHYRDNEKPCSACRGAHKAYQKAYSAARHVAVQRLVAAHPDEYRAHLHEALPKDGLS